MISRCIKKVHGILINRVGFFRAEDLVTKTYYLGSGSHRWL